MNKIFQLNVFVWGGNNPLGGGRNGKDPKFLLMEGTGDCWISAVENSVVLFLT